MKSGILKSITTLAIVLTAPVWLIVVALVIMGMILFDSIRDFYKHIYARL